MQLRRLSPSRVPSLEPLELSFRRKNPSWSENTLKEGYQPKPPVLPFELFPDQEAVDQKAFRRSVLIALIALIAHVIFLAFRPQLHFWDQPEQPEAIRTVFVMQPTRFRAPAPLPAGGQPTTRKTKALLPVPDLTPDLPEPILPEIADIGFPEIDLTIEIPPGPGGTGSSQSRGAAGGRSKFGQGYGAREVSGDTLPPETIYAPQPRYTEAARQEKLQGFVVVETIIDKTQ